jgi:2-amino-4-hydroxy-6-hydroxymethyldihydropteridine diphosphokinase
VVDFAFIALGSNLGDREGYLAYARAAIAAIPRTLLMAATHVEETMPFGPVEQGPFLNQMVAVETELSPRELLIELQRIETVARRERAVRWGPRTLDLDIVAFGRQRMQEPDLLVPHPGLRERDFWRRELADLREVLAAPVAFA